LKRDPCVCLSAGVTKGNFIKCSVQQFRLAPSGLVLHFARARAEAESLL